MEKRYGGIVKISMECLLEVLGIKGTLRGVKDDPLTKTVDLYIEGARGEFGELCEAEIPHNYNVVVTTQEKKEGYLLKNPAPFSQNEIVSVDLVDLETGNKYNHFKKEDVLDGKETSKKEDRGGRDTEAKEETKKKSEKFCAYLEGECNLNTACCECKIKSERRARDGKEAREVIKNYGSLICQCLPDSHNRCTTGKCETCVWYKP